MPAASRLAALSLLVLVCGCGETQNAEVTGYRKSLLLNSEPTDTVTIEAARKNIETQSDFALIGKVGNKEIPQWWTEGQATLIISEGSEGSHYNVSADHDPKTCPFCSRNWKTEDSMAFVEFHDAAGKIIPVDTKQLLNLKTGQEVVVRGTGKLDEDGLLVLIADGVFIRNPK